MNIKTNKYFINQLCFCDRKKFEKRRIEDHKLKKGRKQEQEELENQEKHPGSDRPKFKGFA